MPEPNSITPEFNEAARIQEEKEIETLQEHYGADQEQEQQEAQETEQAERAKKEEEELAAQQRDREAEEARKKKEEEEKEEGEGKTMVEEDGNRHDMHPPEDIREAPDKESYNGRLSEEFNKHAQEKIEQECVEDYEIGNDKGNDVNLNNDPKGPSLG